MRTIWAAPYKLNLGETHMFVENVESSITPIIHNHLTIYTTCERWIAICDVLTTRPKERSQQDLMARTMVYERIHIMLHAPSLNASVLAAQRTYPFFFDPNPPKVFMTFTGGG